MPNFKSTQETKRTSTPPKKLATHELGGRVRNSFFEFTTPVGGCAIGDTINLCFVPAGARILPGTVIFEAMTSGGALATIAIGDGTTVDKFMVASSVDAAGKLSFADTIVHNAGMVAATDIIVTATVSVEGLAAGKKLFGWLPYVTD